MGSEPPRILRNSDFAGDQKRGNWLLVNWEQRFLNWLVPRVPGWLGTVPLTLLTLLWGIGLVYCGFRAAENLQWLWVFNLFILLQYITDMLDGAVGRARKTGLVKWGYYMDHFWDYIFLCSIFLGYSFLIPLEYKILEMILLILAVSIMVNAFLYFAVTNEFRISFCRFGTSEIRYCVIGFNIAVMHFGQAIILKALPYAIGLTTLAVFSMVFMTQQQLRTIDLAPFKKPSR